MVLEELLEADLPGRVGCFGLTDGAGPVALANICDCVSTTVLHEGCCSIPLMVYQCCVLDWSRPRVLCVPRVLSVGRKWIPNTTPGKTPLGSCSSRGEGFGV